MKNLNMKAMRSTSTIRLAGVMVLLGSLVSPRAVAQSTATPADVYRVLRVARVQIEQIRNNANVTTPWPQAGVSEERYSRHVLQKCFEVLSKINRVRFNHNMGAITIPRYPTREITPNEVLSAAKRLIGECHLLVSKIVPLMRSEPTEIPNDRSITAADNYRLLSELSLALDPVLGLRGFTPGDVYAQSVRVLENTRFIRFSQNLPADVEQPALRAGMHPNHALQAAVSLMTKTAQAESHLWMKPCDIPGIPQRKIEPNEVYDVLQIVLAEQQRIKYRLGLERHFETPPVELDKTPSDVIQNLEWAEALMPDFSINRTLIQYDPRSLRKSPDDVFAIASAISDQLLTYREARGIRVDPRSIKYMPGRQPKHVYQKTLECLEKINRLRVQVGFGRTASLEYPLRQITPSEVYDLADRIGEELKLVGKHGKIDLVVHPGTIATEGKTPSDVYLVMSRNSSLLDTIIGTHGYTPDDVYRQAKRIINEFELLRSHLGVTSPIVDVQLVDGKEPRHVIQIAHQIINLMAKVQRRAGMTQIASSPMIMSENVTPNEVFNEVGITLAELVSLKVHLGIGVLTNPVAMPSGKTPSHVYQQMEYARRQLASILGLSALDEKRPRKAGERRP